MSIDWDDPAERATLASRVGSDAYKGGAPSAHRSDRHQDGQRLPNPL